MESKTDESEKEENIYNVKKMFLFLIEYAYIMFYLYIILAIVSLYTALHCNDVFSFETFFAITVPYIYLPLRYYFKNHCNNMPSQMCIA